MKKIKLCYDDPDLFQTSVTSTRCDFVLGHFEAFMQMYKTQGSTFWLRFLVSFKNHVEEKFCSNKKWLAFLMNHYHFIKVLNFIYISLHKKFLEGSNTAVKKFIHNLIALALNSPSYLNYSCQQWLIYIKSCKQLHNIFQSLFKMSEPIELTGFTAFLFTVYTDFFCALCAVFEQWYKANDLTEEELKKIDSKIIYWLPSYDTEQKIQPSCFEKYLADYWKENLQRMLLTDAIHDRFSAHKSAGCCEKFDKEKSIFKVFQFTDKHTIELMKILNNEGDTEDSEEESVHTITEVCMKDICILKPQAALCSSHKKCFVKICHVEACLEPFVCKGDEPCSQTCETKLKSVRKQEKKSGKKPEKFWKTITAEIFPIDKKKCDVSTLAESYNRDIQTYLQVRESYELDMPLSVLRHTYHQCLAELHNFDLNPRRTECLNRLRKKLSKKNPSNSVQFNVSSLRQPFYRESLLESAMEKMVKFREQYCLSKGHDIKKCETQCFSRAANTVAVSTSNAFGRVILLSKTYITIPYELTACSNKLISDKSANSNNGKKNGPNKLSETVKNNKKSMNSSVIGSITVSNSIAKENVNNVEPVSEESKKEIKDDPEDDLAKEVTDDDEDIDEILKLIGIGEPEKNLMDEEINDAKLLKMPSKDEQAVSNFFQLIGVNEATLDQDRTYASQEDESNNIMSLKVCAYCKKRETQRKMFKKCSRCKEENFPVQHYYCSRECLLEDWAETHEEEHLRFNKQAS